MNSLIASVVVAISVAVFPAQVFSATRANMVANSNHNPLLVEGLVKKIDKAALRVTLFHGPLANGMPSMSMAYHVKEANWLNEMKVGQKIRFAADEVNGAMTMVQFEEIQ